MNEKKGIKIKYVTVSLLVFYYDGFTTKVNWYSSDVALRQTLKSNYLESNYQYATKIAGSTNCFRIC